MMESLKSGVGLASARRTIRLSAVEMKDFANCVKATVGNTSHSDISSASIPTVFTIFRDGEFELIDRLGIQLKQVLHGEQEYEVFHTLSPDEEIGYVTSISSVMEKKGKTSEMAFIVFETDFVRTSDSVRVAYARSTMVYRKTVKA